MSFDFGLDKIGRGMCRFEKILGIVTENFLFVGVGGAGRISRGGSRRWEYVVIIVLIDVEFGRYLRDR